MCVFHNLLCRELGYYGGELDDMNDAFGHSSLKSKMSSFSHFILKHVGNKTEKKNIGNTLCDIDVGKTIHVKKGDDLSPINFSSINEVSVPNVSIRAFLKYFLFFKLNNKNEAIYSIDELVSLF